MEYVVRLGSPEGAVFEQRHRAVSAEALRRELEGKGLHVFALNPARGRVRVRGWLHRDRFNSLEFLVFNQQLATLLKAGIPVLQSLELLQKAQTNASLRDVLTRVLEDVRSGLALSEAFRAQGELFPRLYCAALMAGERSGELVSVLRRYITHQQMLETVRRRVTSALTYPAVLMLLALGLVTLLMTYVIPRFATFYLGFGSQLPLPTLLVLGTANFLQKNLLFILPGLLAVGWVVRRRAQTDAGRVAVDRLPRHPDRRSLLGQFRGACQIPL